MVAGAVTLPETLGDRRRGVCQGGPGGSVIVVHGRQDAAAEGLRHGRPRARRTGEGVDGPPHRLRPASSFTAVAILQLAAGRQGEVSQPPLEVRSRLSGGGGDHGRTLAQAAIGESGAITTCRLGTGVREDKTPIAAGRWHSQREARLPARVELDVQRQRVPRPRNHHRKVSG